MSYLNADGTDTKTARGYVADQDTELYYLQSRYYNPEMGRFINADSYVSTGQGILGNNMFAYCSNNPVRDEDPTGELFYPGEIHNEVARRVAATYGLYREQHIYYKNTVHYGRADLVSATGQVWDVKRDTPWHIAAGQKQVEKYASNIWAAHPETSLSVGSDPIQTSMFYYESVFATYKVTYRDAGAGVIAYDYSVTELNAEALATTVLVAVSAAVLGFVSGFFGGAATLFALI